MSTPEDPDARYERNVEQLRRRLQGYRDAGVRPANVQFSAPGLPFRSRPTPLSKDMGGRR